MPVVSNSNGFGFDVPFSNFSYLLGGGPVTGTPGRVRFFVDSANGLLAVNLVDTGSPPDGVPDTGFVFFGAQAFTGTTNSPTILTGSYAATGGVFYSNGGQPTDDLSGSVVSISLTDSAGPAVPEPSSLAIVASACCLFLWLRYRPHVN